MSVDTQYLDPDEQIKIIIRKHWINLFPILVAWAIIGAVILAGFFAVGRYADNISQIGSVSLLVLALIALAALWALLVYLSYWVYRENRLILTDRSFTQITRNGILQSNTTHFHLEKVQDVTVVQKGLWPHLLKYGDLVIETAGELPNLTFRQVGQPHIQADKIMDLHEHAAISRPPNP